MQKLAILMSFFSLAAFADRANVTFQGTPETLTISGQTLNIYPEAIVETNGQQVPVKLTGNGVRVKAVLGAFKVNVYALASYVDVPSSLKPEPIGGLKNAKAKVMQMWFLRNISGEELRVGFEEALDINNVDLNSTAMKSLLSQFTFDLKAGQTGHMVAVPNASGSMEEISVRIMDKLIEEKDKELGTNIWRMWFGVPVDKEMGDLKTALVGKVK